MGMVSQEEFDHHGERLIWMTGEIGKVATGRPGKLAPNCVP
jgi:hypothetical protein